MEPGAMRFTHHARGKNADELTREFEFNESFRMVNRKDSVRLYHEILSFRAESTPHLTKRKLEELTQEYVNLRAPNGVVFAGEHRDKEHVHVHLCISGTQYMTGRSMRISKGHLQRAKLAMSELIRSNFPELSGSLVEHGKGGRQKVHDKEIQLKRRTGKPSRRDELKAKVTGLFRRSSSFEAFNQLLNKESLQTYERGGKPYGVIDQEGRRHRFRAMSIDITELNRSNSRLAKLQKMRKGKGSRERVYDLDRTRELGGPRNKKQNG